MLQAAVIGCGVIGPVHAAALRMHRAVRLRWACDRDPARLGRIEAERTATDAAVVLADPAVDLVCICTEHPAHAALVEAALAAGKHVLCEKPLASTPADLNRILAAAAARPRQVAAGVFQHRHAPLARRLRQLLADGAFGAISAVEVAFACTRDAAYFAADAWRGRRVGEGGGVALNQGIHTIDLALWLASLRVESVAGRVRRRRLAGIEVEDLFEAEARCADGVTATLTCDNDGVTHWRQRIAIRGERGSVTLGDGHRLLAIEHASEALGEELRALDATHLDGRPLGGAKAVYGYHHALQIADVVEAVLAGRPPFVGVADAVQANAVVLAAYHATRTGAPAALPLDPSTYSYPELPLESA
jgi:UDP-N-acetyl-2-amino-2-deoxyglucuronate dehydrogenase